MTDEEFYILLKGAHSGEGTKWLDAAECLEFATLALRLGFGIQVMEARAMKGKRGLQHQIIGLEGNESWDRHRNAARAFELLKEKLRRAAKDEMVLEYKVWVDKGASEVSH